MTRPVLGVPVDIEWPHDYRPSFDDIIEARGNSVAAEAIRSRRNNAANPPGPPGGQGGGPPPGKGNPNQPGTDDPEDTEESLGEDPVEIIEPVDDPHQDSEHYESGAYDYDDDTESYGYESAEGGD